MTASGPLLTALRLGAIVLAVGVGGYLVVAAQQRATGDRDASPERTLAQPTLGPQGDAGGALPEPADPYLFSSKSAAIEVVPEGVTASGNGARESGDVFLPSSKDPGPDVLLPGPALEAVETLRPGDPDYAEVYLPSSKILSPDALRAASGTTPPPPKDPAFLRSSKSLTIDGALLGPRPDALDPSTISSDGLVIPNDDVRAAWEALSEEEKRAIYLTTSKSLSPDALPGAKGADAKGPEAKGLDANSGEDAPNPRKD